MPAERSDAQIREELRTERAALADAVDDLRGALDVGSKVKANLPVVAAGAFGLGFLKAGGVGAAMRLLMRRRREGAVKAQVGRFRLIDRK
jgi:hypothetical protein